ncbi:hypothetical protein ACQ4M3_25525 [Leptolyngbya sp. AN03gr2]|uniref:hypothetical protein n=1 Tax=unclassified Leptolyngbya TaxID=2650499 RepID=UPI003D314D63
MEARQTISALTVVGQIPIKSLTLEEFLQLPEIKPIGKYIARLNDRCLPKKLVDL